MAAWWRPRGIQWCPLHVNQIFRFELFSKNRRSLSGAVYTLNGILDPQLLSTVFFRMRHNPVADPGGPEARPPCPC